MTAKRGRNAFGSVRKLPSGMFQASITEPDSGQRRAAPSTFKTKGDAHDWLAKVRVDLARGDYVDPAAGKERLKDYAVSWLAGKAKLAYRTRNGYEDLLRLHINPHLGMRALRSIDTATVREWNAMLVTKFGMDSPTPAKAYRLLHAILDTAEIDRRIGRNPCTIAGAGVERAKERPVIEPEDVYKLASKMPEHLSALTLLLGFSGLRLGEALGLQRRHIDLLHNTLTVEQQRHEAKPYGDKSHDGLGKPKTDAGRRTLPLPAALSVALEAHMEAWTPAGATSFVFIGEKGGPLRRASWYHHFDKAKRRLGYLPAQFKTHDLRHTNETIHARNGATTKELMVTMGHSTPAAALRYQHSTQARQSELAQRMAAEMEKAASSAADHVDAVRSIARCAG